jgi:hypothetical protein
MCFFLVGCLTRKNYAIQERLARDKHLILLQKFVNYAYKKFYNSIPRSLPIKESLKDAPLRQALALLPNNRHTRDLPGLGENTREFCLIVSEE